MSKVVHLQTGYTPPPLISPGELQSLEGAILTARQHLDDLWDGFEDAHKEEPVYDAPRRLEAGRESVFGVLQSLRAVEMELDAIRLTLTRKGATRASR